MRERRIGLPADCWAGSGWVIAILSLLSVVLYVVASYLDDGENVEEGFEPFVIVDYMFDLCFLYVQPGTNSCC